MTLYPAKSRERSFAKFDLCGAILSLCAFASCAPDASSTSEDEAVTGDDLGVIQQGLSGNGAFWLPNRGEMHTYVNYCFTNLQEAGTYRNALSDALRRSWGKYANIIFDDRGDCTAQPFGWVGLRIDPDSRRSATGNPSSVTGSGGILASPAVWLPMIPGLPAQVCGLFGLVDERECFMRIATHEFGHVLGFSHESQRGDRPSNAPCPHGIIATTGNGGGVPPNTFITDYDSSSMMDTGYCLGIDMVSNLSANDIAGVQAVYGAGTNRGLCPSATGCLKVKYANLNTEVRQYAIRFQTNARWLNMDSSGNVSSQSYIGEWERVRFLPAGAAPADGFVHYGDVVHIIDRWGRFLNSDGSRRVTTAAAANAWEKWVVETRDAATAPLGSPVFVNAPLRLASQSFGYRLMNSNGTVSTSPATSTGELRINGPFVIK